MIAYNIVLKLKENIELCSFDFKTYIPNTTHNDNLLKPQ
jgi:hypothetical protein